MSNLDLELNMSFVANSRDVVNLSKELANILEDAAKNLEDVFQAAKVWASLEMLVSLVKKLEEQALEMEKNEGGNHSSQ